MHGKFEELSGEQGLATGCVVQGGCNPRRARSPAAVRPPLLTRVERPRGRAQGPLEASLLGGSFQEAPPLAHSRFMAVRALLLLLIIIIISSSAGARGAQAPAASTMRTLPGLHAEPRARGAPYPPLPTPRPPSAPPRLRLPAGSSPPPQHTVPPPRPLYLPPSPSSPISGVTSVSHRPTRRRNGVAQRPSSSPQRGCSEDPRVAAAAAALASSGRGRQSVVGQGLQLLGCGSQQAKSCTIWSQAGQLASVGPGQPRDKSSSRRRKRRSGRRGSEAEAVAPCRPGKGCGRRVGERCGGRVKCEQRHTRTVDADAGWCEGR
jgi:hypothetical protein